MRYIFQNFYTFFAFFCCIIPRLCYSINMSKKEIEKAVLTKTLSRLSQQIKAERDALTHLVGIRALATERMLHADERAYLAALADYRLITHPHASIPQGCRA